MTDRMRMLRSFLQPATTTTGNDEQMGSTFFGDAVAAGAGRCAAPRQPETDRGIDGRAGGYA
jgi:hypothetical protein